MRLKEDAEYLATARPTAVNLSWALKRLVRHFEELRPKTVQQAKKELLLEARRIQEEDVCLSCHGTVWPFAAQAGHGNSDPLQCRSAGNVRYGTCLAPIYLGQEQGYDFYVFADETRPLLQGAALQPGELQNLE